MTIYIVCGTCGEYSDRQLWTVATYTSREMAELHARLAKEKAPAAGAEWEEREKPNPYDPGMQTDYTGTDYRVEETELYAHLDQYLETL